MVVAAQQRPGTISRLEKGFLNIYFHFPPFFEEQVLNTSGTPNASVEGAWGSGPSGRGAWACYGLCEPQPLRPCPVPPPPDTPGVEAGRGRGPRGTPPWGVGEPPASVPPRQARLQPQLPSSKDTDDI